MNSVDDLEKSYIEDVYKLVFLMLYGLYAD